jgi:hypothetical protein
MQVLQTAAIENASFQLPCQPPMISCATMPGRDPVTTTGFVLCYSTSQRRVLGTQTIPVALSARTKGPVVGADQVPKGIERKLSGGTLDQGHCSGGYGDVSRTDVIGRDSERTWTSCIGGGILHELGRSVWPHLWVSWIHKTAQSPRKDEISGPSNEGTKGTKR